MIPKLIHSAAGHLLGSFDGSSIISDWETLVGLGLVVLGAEAILIPLELLEAAERVKAESVCLAVEDRWFIAAVPHARRLARPRGACAEVPMQAWGKSRAEAGAIARRSEEMERRIDDDRG